MSRTFTLGRLWGYLKLSQRLYGNARVLLGKEPRHQLLPKFSFEKFMDRHIGPRPSEVKEMLSMVGYANMKDFITAVLPLDLSDYAMRVELPGLPTPLGEAEVQSLAREIAGLNRIRKCYIGMGYYGTLMPAPIQRGILESPAWYTQYTPYQPEISQGRLEGLLNFQTMICELTELPIANASLLDEGTAAAEAMVMLFHATGSQRRTFLVDRTVFPQTIACLQTRAEPLGINLIVFDRKDDIEFNDDTYGLLLQYPDGLGRIDGTAQIINQAKAAGIRVACAADILALTLIKSPGELGVDVAIGSTQRFGVPLGYGGPHAAYFATTNEYRRRLPGRIVGISRDRQGIRSLRLALQTREQHIRRDKATSNICTAQALLANISAMYAVYHGPNGLCQIAERINQQAILIANSVQRFGHELINECFFDTVVFRPRQGVTTRRIHRLAGYYNVTLGNYGEGLISISLDETTNDEDIQALLNILALQPKSKTEEEAVLSTLNTFTLGTIGIADEHRRSTSFMRQKIFNSYHSETEISRYIHELQSKDLSLVQSMIPLGSCSMKLNGATEMISLTLPGFSSIHPFVPISDATGYQRMIEELKSFLCAITGFSAISLQPNSGAQGEYAGLCVIRAFHRANNQSHRDICIIPVSAHGTNPASATLAGLRVVPVKCGPEGNIDKADLDVQLATHRDRLACVMITFPSTFGIFEEGIRQVIDKVHSTGALVYMDGANMNAQMGYIKPGDLGVDVAHLNLHKTFCIPHGGGGPGVGPIGVRSNLVPFLPSHPLVEIPEATSQSIGPVSAAPFGSAGIFCVSWAYLRLMGEEGIRKCSEMALLNANYMMHRLEGTFPILYRNKAGLCAHEFIIDCRPFKQSADIEVIDIAKRLQDYSIHTPTMNWPVPGTLMIEPTESESLAELDRVCDSLLSIRGEIGDIERGRAPRDNNILKNAPHPVNVIVSSTWDKPYSREQAAFPMPSLRTRKFWPTVSRLDDVYGDLYLQCSLDGSPLSC